MLDALDQIKWDELSHAYGKATDVPDLLRALASNKKEVCDDALNQLFGNIWHQGTVYPATAYAVPFLIELLREPAVDCKAGILALLESLASGSSYLDAHKNMDWYHNERKTEGFQVAMRRELDWVREAHIAVLEGTPAYLRLLSHPESSVRVMVPYLLGSCPERMVEIEPALCGRVLTEDDPEVKASILMTLAQLWRWTSRREAIRSASALQPHDFFVNIFRVEAELAVVRFVAALSTLEIGGENAIEEALPVIRETVSACRAVFSQLPLGGSSLGAVSGALSPDPHLSLQWLLEALAHSDPEIRKDAIWEIGIICRQRRSAPQAVIPYLVTLVADPDPEVRERAAHALPELGKARYLALDALNSFLSHSDRKVRALAKKTLAKIRKNRDEFNLKRWLGKPKKNREVAGLIAILDRQGSSRRFDDQQECSDAAAALGFKGRRARDAVPALRRALSHDDPFVRVHAARALWKITQGSDEVLPVLLEELRCRPTGLLAADCLGEMGRRAQAAIPALRRIIDSEERLVQIGGWDHWVDEDESFREGAKQTLARIEADIAAL